MTFLRYFGTDGIRGKVGKIPMTPDFMLRLGQSIGMILNKNKKNRFIIGRDTRISGNMIQSALEFGILSTGVSTLLAGCIPTPAISYLTKCFNASAGIVISGSHNLFCDNGIKIFSEYGIKITKNLENLIENNLINSLNFLDFINFGSSKKIRNAKQKYINFCKNTIPKNVNLSKFTIVLDCANGSTYHIAPRIFRDLGAKVINFSINPDGININKNSGSTDILALKKIVLLEKADIGLAFDGDGDRVIMVDHLGNKVDGDQIIYIIAKEYLKQKKLKFGGVVGTSMSNMGLQVGLRNIGIPFFSAKIGDRYVYEALIRKKWLLGAEKSGHIILLNKHSTGDGIIASLQVLLSMINNHMTLYDLVKPIRLFPQILLSVFLKKDQSIKKNKEIKAILNQSKRILGDKGRVLLRQSGTESCIRIMVEGENYKKISNLAYRIADAIKLI